jgi:hypothetical protein
MSSPERGATKQPELEVTTDGDEQTEASADGASAGTGTVASPTITPTRRVSHDRVPTSDSSFQSGSPTNSQGTPFSPADSDRMQRRGSVADALRKLQEASEQSNATPPRQDRDYENINISGQVSKKKQSLAEEGKHAEIKRTDSGFTQISGEVSKKKQSLADEGKKATDNQDAKKLQRRVSLERLANKGNVQERRSSFAQLQKVSHLADGQFPPSLCNTAKYSVQKKLMMFIKTTITKAKDAEVVELEAQEKGACALLLLLLLMLLLLLLLPPPPPPPSSYFCWGNLPSEPFLTIARRIFPGYLLQARCSFARPSNSLARA